MARAKAWICGGAFFLLAVLNVNPAQATASLAELSGNELSYEVSFTNPICDDYYYRYGVDNRAGDQVLRKKPKNVYCTQKDQRASERRRNSPTQNILSWIQDPNTTEIFMAFLSFSNGTIADALCEAVKTRKMKLRMVLDKGSDSPEKLKRMWQVSRCAKDAGDEDLVQYVLRGRSGGIRYAHNKVIYINPNDDRAEAKIAFGSANLSSGVVLHHENWNFVRAPKRSFFAQKHLCLMEGMWKDSTSGSTSAYAKFISDCTRKISSAEEKLVKTFFVPGEGDDALYLLTGKIRSAKRISIAAHRFSNGRIISELRKKLKGNPGSVRLIVDDDTFWAGKTGEQVGGLGPGDYRKVEALERVGLDVRFMETNHHSGRFLHHNKFMVIEHYDGSLEVYTGAGNWTSAAYSMNYENFYFVQIPDVAKAFADQYEYMWNELATPEGNLPERDISAR